MWELLGFNKNILFNTPIEIEENAPNLLSGRTNELVDLIKEILADEKLLKIVSGKTGIGKTSFLNVLQYLFYTKSDFFKDINIYKKLLPCYHRIELRNEDNLESVFIKVLKSLSKSIKEHYANTDSKTPQEIKEIINYWLGLKSEDSASEQSSELHFKIVKSTTNTSLSDIYLNKTDPSYSFKVLIELIIQHTDLKGVFLIFDNLEIVDTKNLIGILNEIRDEILLKKDVYYLIITADHSLLSKIHSDSKRVSGVINSVEVELKPLNNFQLSNAIEERIQVFSNGKNEHHYLPFTEDLLYKIFQFTNKDLRETFKILQFITLKGFSSQAKIANYCNGTFQIEFTEGIDYLVEYAEKICQKTQIDIFNKELLSKLYLANTISINEYSKYNFCNEQQFPLS
jgi:hypothetical protein